MYYDKDKVPILKEDIVTNLREIVNNLDNIKESFTNGVNNRHWLSPTKDYFSEELGYMFNDIEKVREAYKNISKYLDQVVFNYEVVDKFDFYEPNETGLIVWDTNTELFASQATKK